MNAPGALLVVGELCADIVVELAGPPVFEQHEQLAPRTTITMGSSSAITACGAAALGVPTSIVGVLGDDLLGAFLFRELTERHVDVTGCRVDPTTPTGTSTILTLPDGNRSILTSLGSIGHVRAADIPADALGAARHLHVGSYFLQHHLQPDLPALFGTCRHSGVTTSIDPNFDPTGEWDAGLRDALAETTVFFCNADEALRISRMLSVDSAVEWFAQHLPDGATLIVKAGEHGATAYAIGDHQVTASHHEAPVPDGRPLVDTVGAGDSLASGYLAGRLRGWLPQACLQLGVRNGTASTRAAGGVAGQLTWASVESPP